MILKEVGTCDDLISQEVKYHFRKIGKACVNAYLLCQGG